MANRQSQFPNQTKKDVPEALVSASLKRIRQEKVKLQEWQKLVDDPEQANLVRFIEGSSYILAPTDPFLRAQISCVLIEQHYLEENGRVINELSESWNKNPKKLRET
ncbi:MAG TPA: hypothetical protein VMR95_03430 [Candidatus Binatia bacterium]|nr:hypothetical protein [Candidatus Binatia bacterium]